MVNPASTLFNAQKELSQVHGDALKEIPKKNPRAALFTAPVVVDAAPYKPGASLSLDFVSNDGVTTRTTAKILQAFTPFTYSQAMLVQFENPTLLGIPSNEKVIIKTFDRRFMNRHNNVGPWDPANEAELKAAIQSRLYTALPDFPISGPWLNAHLWASWQVEYRVWQLTHHYFDTEVQAYRKLADCHGQNVPKLFGTVKLHLENEGDFEHDIISRPVGLVLQFVDGVPIADVKVGQHISEDSLPRVKADCMQITRDLQRCGVIHNDIHSKNVLLRHADGKPFVIDFGHSECPEGEDAARILKAKDETGDMEQVLSWRDAYDVPSPALPMADDTERRMELLGGRRPSRGPFGFIHSYRQECGSSMNDSQSSLLDTHSDFGMFTNPWVSPI